MKTLDVCRLKLSSSTPDLREISEKLDSPELWQKIDTVNWAGFSYRPSVSFAIAHSGREILIKFKVTESHFKAEKLNSNDNVYEDSCVEFFVSPADDGIYYNLEFNALGTCLMGSGTARDNSTRVDPALISRIRRLPSVAGGPVLPVEGNFAWDITIAIPVDVFFRHHTGDIGGSSFHANFYKCGDKLKIPHYLTWSQVATPVPDFHRPEYFGQIRFRE
jgi:hypothetical protein